MSFDIVCFFFVI